MIQTQSSCDFFLLKFVSAFWNRAWFYHPALRVSWQSNDLRWILNTLERPSDNTVSADRMATSVVVFNFFFRENESLESYEWGLLLAYLALNLVLSWWNWVHWITCKLLLLCDMRRLRNGFIHLVIWRSTLSINSARIGSLRPNTSNSWLNPRPCITLRWVYLGRLSSHPRRWLHHIRLTMIKLLLTHLTTRTCLILWLLRRLKAWW